MLLPIPASFWTVEEVDLSKDLADWEGLKVRNKEDLETIIE